MTNRVQKLTLLMVCGALIAAAQPSAKAEFEVASIKLNNAGQRQYGFQFLPGRFVTTNLSLFVLIGIAYGLPVPNVPPGRLTGGPEWVRSDRYDVEGKVPDLPAGLTAKEHEAKVREMLKALLAERFRLSVRRESKEMPVYAIVVGKGGSKLTTATIGEKDCLPEDAKEADHICHVFNGGQGRGLHGNAVDMEDLASFVANWTDRPLVDRTGIQGLYNIQTDGWTPMPAPVRTPADDVKGENGKLIVDQPTLFEVFEKLGLKLQSQKTPVATYVIERVEKLSGN